MQTTVSRNKIRFLPDSSRVIARFLYTTDERAIGIIRSVVGLTENEARLSLSRVMRDYSLRHRNVNAIFERHFSNIAHLFAQIKTNPDSLDYNRKLLIGAYFTMFLEMATTIGAVVGALLAGILSANAISIIFAGILVYSAFSSILRRKGNVTYTEEDKYAKLLKLNGEYPTGNGMERYSARNVPFGFGLSSLAGVMSGLLGIGGGAIKVIAMDGSVVSYDNLAKKFVSGSNAPDSVKIYGKAAFQVFHKDFEGL